MTDNVSPLPFDEADMECIMKACMVVYAFYETDSRVRRYAESLVARGYDVDTICLRRDDQSPYGVLKGVRLFRIQHRVMNERHKFSYLFRLLRFFVKSALVLTRKHLQEPYDLIHVHSVPDFEVFAAWLPQLLGAKVILDIHDLVPELYASKFNVRRDAFLFKMLVMMERLSARAADHVFASNDIWRETLTSRSVANKKCTTFLNYPDPAIFWQRKRTRADGKFVMMYPGTVNWHQGVDIAIRAFNRAKEQIPNAELHIYGDGYQKGRLADLIDSLGLQGQVLLKDFVPLEEISEHMANADLGIVPKRNDDFGGKAFSTKILEFMALGVPLIISRTEVDRYYFNDSIVKFFRPEDENDLTHSMLLLAHHAELRQHLSTNALRFVEEFSWDRKKDRYFEIVDNLVAYKSLIIQDSGS